MRAASQKGQYGSIFRGAYVRNHEIPLLLDGKMVFVKTYPNPIYVGRIVNDNDIISELESDDEMPELEDFESLFF